MDLIWILVGSGVASFGALASAIASWLVSRKLEKKQEQDLASVQEPFEIPLDDDDIERLLCESRKQYYGMDVSYGNPVHPGAKNTAIQMSLFESDEIRQSPASLVTTRTAEEKQPMQKAGQQIKRHKTAA
jgi:hypothetical protein